MKSVAASSGIERTKRVVDLGQLTIDCTFFVCIAVSFCKHLAKEFSVRRRAPTKAEVKIENRTMGDLTIEDFLLTLGSNQTQNFIRMQEIMMNMDQRMAKIENLLKTVEKRLEKSPNLDELEDPSVNDQPRIPQMNLKMKLNHFNFPETAGGSGPKAQSTPKQKSSDDESDSAPEEPEKLSGSTNLASFDSFLNFCLFFRSNNFLSRLQANLHPWIRRIHATCERNLVQAISVQVWKIV